MPLLLLRSLLLILKMPLQPAWRRCCRVLCAAAGPVWPPQRHLSTVRGVFDFEPLLCSGGLAAAQRIVATSRALANFLSTRSCHTGQPAPFLSPWCPRYSAHHTTCDGERRGPDGERTPPSESTKRLLAVMLELHSHELGKNCRRDKINTHVTNRFN